jgi:hypothetical protein
VDLFPKKRQVKLDPEGAAIVRRQIEQFRKKFGRDPGPGDPLFFDPDADHPRRLQLEPLEAGMVRTMKDAGIRPEIIYAFEKTGRLVTETNYKNLSKADLAEWEAAIDEYFKKRQ